MEEFKKYFSEISLKPRHDVPASPPTYNYYLPEPVVNIMYHNPITKKNTVIQITQKQNQNWVPVVMVYPPNYYTQATHTHNQFVIWEVHVIDQIKIAKVVPIYKSSQNIYLSNHRTIRLLPAISKLLEKIIFDKVMGFLTSNVLYTHQNRFRPRHSTIHPVTHVFNHCAEANNETKPWQYSVIYQKPLT